MDFHQYLNHIKLFFLVMKTGSDVFVWTLKVLYKGPHPIEDHLADHVDNKSSGLNKDQKKLLIKIKKRKRDLKHLDITLAYKLIQLTCGLEPNEDFLGNKCVWSKRCPVEKQSSLEHLLYKYKTNRNFLAHRFTSVGLISDEIFNQLKDDNVSHLKTIVEKVGDLSKLPKDEIGQIQDQISVEIEIFCQGLMFSGSNMVNSSVSAELPLHLSGKTHLQTFFDNSDTEDSEKSRESSPCRSRSKFRENRLDSDSPELSQDRPQSKSSNISRRRGLRSPEISLLDTSEDALPSEEQYQGNTLQNDVPCSGLPVAQVGDTRGTFMRAFVPKRQNDLKYYSKSKLERDSVCSSKQELFNQFHLLRQTMFCMFEEDTDQRTSLEKCDRMYWINKLLCSDTLKTQRNIKKFWKEYENDCQ